MIELFIVALIILAFAVINWGFDDHCKSMAAECEHGKIKGECYDCWCDDSW